MFVQLNGPKLNVLLDLEPIRPEEAEATAALRLLGRMRRVYGVRFFDALTIDAWYVQGPFLKAVEKLGWGWEVVLKQERMEVFQEARQLSAGQKPVAEFDAARRQRHVPLWDVKDLTFTESYGHTVSVVHSHETWTETKVLGGKKTHQQNASDWRWMLCDQLKGYPPPMAYEAGHRRWGIENQAFNELTQYYHGTLLSSRTGRHAGPDADPDAGLCALQCVCRAAQPAGAARTNHDESPGPRPGSGLGSQSAVGAVV